MSLPPTCVHPPFLKVAQGNFFWQGPKTPLKARLFDRFDLVLRGQSDKTTWRGIDFAMAWMFFPNVKPASTLRLACFNTQG